MILKLFLIIISFGLFIYLFADAFMRFDIAATKNNGLAIERKLVIDKMQNIDSVKVKAKNEIDFNRQKVRDESRHAIMNIWILITLLLIQVFFCTKQTKRQKIV